MFERFTNQARRVVVLAQEESRELNHNYIGTEHLVLGLLREAEGTGARALESAGITLEAARREVEARVPRGGEQQTGHIPFTPRAKKSLELSLRESLALGQSYIGTGHLVLGLLRKGDGVGIEVLVGLGTDLNAVRTTVIELLEDDSEQGSVRGGTERNLPLRTEMREGALRALLDTIDTRLSAIERHVGITRHVPGKLRAYDREIAEVVEAKEAAVERQDFQRAAALREQEKRLRSDRARVETELAEASGGEGAPVAGGETAADEGTLAGGEMPAAGEETATAGEGTATAGEETPAAGGSGDVPVTGASDEVARLRAEVARLTELLREHDIDLGKPQDPPAAAG
jgi:ATP-dependent Clp protease ATP-binding subunit ClpA